MIEVISLRELGNETPKHFELKYKDLDSKGQGYTQTLKTGGESELRATLEEGGISESEIDNLFENAEH
jgi:hypothetical protein